MDVFSAVTTVAAVLEQCIELMERIRTASKDQRALPDLIKKYTVVLHRCGDVIELIQYEEALQTPKIQDCIDDLLTASDTLKRYLDKRGAIKGHVYGFFRQLIVGKEDKEKLDGIMKDIGAIYQRLTLYIQISNVGLTRGIDESIRANVQAVNAVSQLVRERLGQSLSLRMAQLVEGRPQNDDGTVTLTRDDISILSTDEPMIGSTSPKTVRIIRNNEATRRALQVNSPIGTDIWKDMDFVMIEGNEASEEAIQWNHPLDSVDTFIAALKVMMRQQQHTLAAA